MNARMAGPQGIRAERVRKPLGENGERLGRHLAATPCGLSHGAQPLTLNDETAN